MPVTGEEKKGEEEGGSGIVMVVLAVT